MGYERNTLQLSATLSKHNSPRDDEHEQLWEELRAQVQQVIDDPRYAAITPTTS